MVHSRPSKSGGAARFTAGFRQSPTVAIGRSADWECVVADRAAHESREHDEPALILIDPDNSLTDAGRVALSETVSRLLNEAGFVPAYGSEPPVAKS